MKIKDNMQIFFAIIIIILLLFVALTPTYVASRNNFEYCIGKKNPTLDYKSAQDASLEKKNLRTIESVGPMACYI